MTSWQTILDNFPTEDQLELTEEEQAYIPVYTTNAFAADYKDTRCLFALFQEPAIWCKGIGTTWRFTSDNAELVTRKFRFLVSHLDEVKDFDFIQRTATYNGKQIKWDTLYPEWKYLNNRKVHFQSPSTSEAEETKPSIPGEFEKEESDNSTESDNSDKESTHSKSSTDEDTLNVSNLLQEAETRIIATLQKLTSRPSTPSPQGTPSHPASTLPGSSKLSIPEESSLPTPPVSKGKAKEEPLPQTLASSSRSSQATPVPTATQSETPPVPKGNPKGIPPQIPPHQPCSGRTGPPQRPPSPPAPPLPPPPAIMAGNVVTPKLLGSTPDPYDGNPTKAQAFWNTLANYYTMNDAVYNTDNKKVPAALTNFKAGTRRGDWASDRIADALAVNPTNYGTWIQFQTAFQKQFIPPQVQQEAIKGMHDTYMGN